jgi:2Fe-2S ferredoxin
MAMVQVKGRDGGVQSMDVPPGCPLMEALRDAPTGVEGTCGGQMSCGTCHVYVDPNWLDRLPPMSEDEEMMLDALKDFVEIRPGSRLSCQIPISDALEGMLVEIAPPT